MSDDGVEGNEGGDIEQLILPPLLVFFGMSGLVLGGLLAFSEKRPEKKFLSMLSSVGAGIMFSACMVSLLHPSIDASSDGSDVPTWVPPSVGFTLGSLVVILLVGILPHGQSGWFNCVGYWGVEW